MNGLQQGSPFGAAFGGVGCLSQFILPANSEISFHYCKIQLVFVYGKHAQSILSWKVIC